MKASVEPWLLNYCLSKNILNILGNLKAENLYVMNNKRHVQMQFLFNQWMISWGFPLKTEFNFHTYLCSLSLNVIHLFYPWKKFKDQLLFFSMKQISSFVQKNVICLLNLTVQIIIQYRPTTLLRII